MYIMFDMPGYVTMIKVHLYDNIESLPCNKDHKLEPRQQTVTVFYVTYNHLVSSALAH